MLDKVGIDETFNYYRNGMKNRIPTSECIVKIGVGESCTRNFVINLFITLIHNISAPTFYELIFPFMKFWGWYIGCEIVYEWKLWNSSFFISVSWYEINRTLISVQLKISKRSLPVHICVECLRDVYV